MYASVLKKDHLTISKAKSFLEKAVQQDGGYLPAVYMLAEMYDQVKNQKINLHKSYIETQADTPNQQ